MTKRVLVVEDDEWIGDIWQQSFEAETLRVVRARDGYEAIDRSDEELPDAIVLDIVLPGPNGIALLQELRSHHDLAKIPVVIVTSITDLGDKKLHPYGVMRVFDKSVVTPRELVAAVKGVIS